MKIESVEIEGYGSYHGVHTVPLANQGLVLVLGDNRDEPRMDSNGAAKSTIFEAVDWALFGVVPKGDHVDSIINDESASTRVRVTLYDDDNDRALVVQRQKNRAKSPVLQYWVAGEPNQALDLSETQRLLEQELGLDRDVYHAAVFYAQTDLLKFAESAEKKRMELLSKILPELKQIDAWLEPAKQLARKYAESAYQARTAAAQAQTRSEEAARGVGNFDLQVKEWEDNRLRRAQAVARGREYQIESLVKSEQTAGQVQQAEAELAAMVPPDATALMQNQAELAKARKAETEWRSQAHAASKAINDLRARGERLRREQSGQCSLCGQPITAEHMTRELASIDLQIVQQDKQQREAMAAAQQWAAGVAAIQGRMDEGRRAEAAYQKRKGELEGWLHHAKQSLQDPAAIKQHVAELEREHMKILQSVNPVQAQKEQCRERASGLLREAEQAERVAVQWEQAQRVADFWVAAFGPKGLRNYVLDHRLKEMTDAANHWVRLLTGGTIWVRFETQKMGRSTKKLSNELSIRVFRFNPNGKITERNYRSWSGGEKRRVGWAIDFGLSRLIAARAHKRYDMLVLDEVFRHVDAAGGEAVVEMLHELRKERSSIFVIEHDSAFQAHFEKQWLAVKEGSRSVLHTEQGGNDGQRPQAIAAGKTGARKAKKAVSARAPAKARRQPVRRAE